MANNYYLNAKTYTLELPLGVSGTIKIHPGQYVKGDSFAPMASAGYLTDEGAGEPAAVTATPSLLVYTESSEVETATISAGDGVAITVGGEISADVVAIVGGDGITATDVSGTVTIDADVVDIAAGAGVTVTPVAGTYTIAADIDTLARGAGIQIDEAPAGTFTVSAIEAVDDLTADGAVTVANKTAYMITSVGALTRLGSTLGTPTVTTHDGYTISITSTTAAAHVIGFAAGKVNGGTLNAMTFGGAIGDSISLVAYQGVWYTTAVNNVTLSTEV